MRKYINFDHSKECPSRENLYYECIKCADVIPSKPGKNMRCTCHNIMIDWDAGKLAILDYNLVRLFEEVAP